MKRVNGWEISRKLKNCRFKVISFSGATAQCMADYAKPSLRDNPQQNGRIYSDFNSGASDNNKRRSS